MEILLDQLDNYQTSNYLTSVGYEITKKILNIFDQRSLINGLKLSITDETNDVSVCFYLNNIFVYINDDNSVDIDRVTESDDPIIQYHNQKEFTVDQVDDAYNFLNDLLIETD